MARAPFGTRGPNNDACANATPIACGSSGVFDNSGSDPNDPTDPNSACSFGGGHPGRNTVWFSFTATDTEVRVSLCNLIPGGISDTLLSVYSGTCGNLTEIACNDDFCGLGSQLCAATNIGETYLIKVAAWRFAGTPTGAFNLSVSCPCVSDCVQCQPNDIPENEPDCSDNYVDTTNGGCNSTPPVFSPIACGQTVCGRTGTFTSPLGATRDTDWYEFTLNQATNVTMRATGQFPILIGFINSPCPATAFRISTTGPECTEVSISQCLPAGTYYAFVGASVFAGVPCGADYRMSLECTDCPPGPDNDTCDTAEAIGEGTFNFDNSQSVADGPSPCGLLAADLWYAYTPTCTGTATVSTCGLTALDTAIAIYTDCNAAPLVCLDDFCGLQTQISFPVTAGTTVFIQLGGFNGSRGSGQFTVSCALPCIECDPGDSLEGEPDCFDNYVDTTNGGCNSTPPVFGSITCGETVCGTAGTFISPLGSTRDTDWYEFTLANTTNVTLRGTADFSLLLGFINSPCPATAFIASTVAAQCVEGSVTLCLPPGTYYAFAAPSVFTGVACGTAYRITLDCSDCPPPPENDLCEEAIPVAVPSTTQGTTQDATQDNVPLCVTAVTAPGVWYSVIGTGNTMTASLCNAANQGRHDMKINVYCGECDSLTCITGEDDDPACPFTAGSGFPQPTVDWCSQAGARYLILVQGFGGGFGPFDLDVSDNGQPCVADIQCLPQGACCTGTNCAVNTEVGCDAVGGTYLGDGTDCGEANYVVTRDNEPMEDISGSGTPACSGDDCSALVPLGFSFTYFGNAFTDINVGSNGHMRFGAAATAFGNPASLPTADTYNNVVAPYWDDWRTDVAPAQLQTETRGSAPNRRFIAQWTNVAAFSNNTLKATFQAILHENGCIEYRYGDPLSLISPVVGIENSDGTLGVNVTPIPVTGESVMICPEPVSNPCEATGCPLPGCDDGGVDADFNGDCEVTLTDLATLLSNFGASGSPPNSQGNTNGDANIDLTDLANLLARFGAVCH